MIVAIHIGAHVGRGGDDNLIGVGPDLELRRTKRSVDQLLAVKFCCFCDTVQFSHQLADFLIQRLAVTRAVGGVGRLHGQFSHPLQDVAGGFHRAFCYLRQRNAVIGIPCRLVKAADLAGEALGNGQPGGIVLGAVDAQTRGQALNGRIERRLAHAQVALGGQRGDVRVDSGCHNGTPWRRRRKVRRFECSSPAQMWERWSDCVDGVRKRWLNKGEKSQTNFSFDP